LANPRKYARKVFIAIQALGVLQQAQSLEEDGLLDEKEEVALR
jgi:hypothetical protein